MARKTLPRPKRQGVESDSQHPRGEIERPEFWLADARQRHIADQIAAMFTVAVRKAGIENKRLELSTAAFRRVEKNQLTLL